MATDENRRVRFEYEPRTDIARRSRRRLAVIGEASEDEVLDAFSASSLIALVEVGDTLSAINGVKEMMADLGRLHDNLYEVALWADMLKVAADEPFHAYMVDNQAIGTPETIDAIRALTGREDDVTRSTAAKGRSLGIGPIADDALGGG